MMFLLFAILSFPCCIAKDFTLLPVSNEAERNSLVMLSDEKGQSFEISYGGTGLGEIIDGLKTEIDEAYTQLNASMKIINEMQKGYFADMTKAGAFFASLGAAGRVAAGSCKEILASKPDASSGTYQINLADSGLKDVYCDMTTDGGGWTLASVITSRSRTDCDKYPVNGMNYEGMSKNGNEWASFNKADFNGFYGEEHNTVMRVNSVGAKKVTYYLQRKVATSFDAFHAIRHVPTWGSANTHYVISQLSNGYTASSNSVAHDGGAMKHWENNEARCDGKKFTVSRHGITGDHKGGCEWLYTFEARCTSKTASYCHGTCHNDYGNNLVTTKVWLK